MSEARVRVSIGDATIEIEGTEAFVTAQIERVESIRGRLAANADRGAPDKAADELDLTGVFTVTARGRLEIVPDIPGRTRWDKIANAGRLLAYGTERLQRQRTVTFAAVKAACRAHRCDDPSNLAEALKRQRTAFVFEGRKRQLALALTESGRREAETLIRRFRPPASPDREGSSPG